MKAIVAFGPHQYDCEPNAKVVVNRLAQEKGAEFDHKNVLFISKEEGQGTWGKPLVAGASVRFQVLRHFRGEKVIIFKKRSKKAWKKKNGFRAELTELKVQDIKA